MKKRLLTCLLLCCMVQTLLPAAALAEGEEAPKETLYKVCIECDQAADLEIDEYVGKDDTYHYVVATCKNCGHINTFIDGDKNYSRHTGGDETPTCTTGKTCAKCGMEYGILGHDWGEWQSNGDNKTHTRPCRRDGCDAVDTADCGGDSSATCVTLGTCAACGGQYYSGHSFSNSWSYDANVHWQPCIHCSEARKDEYGHMIVENPMPEYLKSEATCVSPAVYYKSCPLCRYKTETTFIDPYNGNDPNNHDIVQYEAKAPTCTEAGWEAYEACTREGCDYSTKVELSALGHDLVHHEAKAATAAEAGNIECWSCDRCGKYFSDEAGTKEIEEADTAVPKLAPASFSSAKSPQTGDNSRMTIWAALLLVSVFGSAGVVLYGKRKKHAE